MAEQTQPTTPPAQRSRLWLVLPSLGAILIGAAVLVLLFVGNPIVPQPKPAPVPLEGELKVRIMSTGEKKESFQVDEDGALPVRAGEWMSIDARFQEPAYCCIVWIDSQGNVVPLYPWNDGKVEVKDANAIPPPRRQTKALLSPAVIGGGWRFDKHGGLETVLLLARRTPLGEDLRLADILQGIPPTKMRSPKESVSLRFDRGEAAASTMLSINRGDDAESKLIDLPLLERMEKLRADFELVRAVRFAHQGE